MSSLAEIATVASPPGDGITSLSFSPCSTTLLSTSWDGTLRTYATVDIPNTSGGASVKNAVVNTMIKTFTPPSANDPAAILSGCFALTPAELPASNDETAYVPPPLPYVYAGTLSGHVIRLHPYDPPSTPPVVIGTHEKAVSCVAHLGDGIVISCGWDGVLKVWDEENTENNAGGKDRESMELNLNGKAFSMDVHPDSGQVIVGCSGRRVIIARVGRAGSGSKSCPKVELMQDRESSLKYQTRCVKFFPNGTGFALGSIEGRIAIEYVNPLLSKEEKKKYAFKCHRIDDTVYPVNCISFHAGYGTFASGGCDGVCNIWDYESKKKLVTLPKFPTSVSAVCFDSTGKKLAIASSYTFEEGEKDAPPDEIYVKEVQDFEVKGKTS